MPPIGPLPSIDLHKANLPPGDRGRLYDSIIKARGVTARQVAQELGVSESLISRHRDLLDLAPDLQEHVNAGTLDYSKAFVIAREPDFVKQRELASSGMNSQELRARVRRQKTEQTARSEERTARIRIEVDGCTVTISGASGLSLTDAISAVASAEKELKSGRDRGLTAKTISRMAAEKIAAQRAKTEGV